MQINHRGMAQTLETRETLETVHFRILTQAEQQAAIRRMAVDGWSDYGIASATRLSVEQVRRTLTSRERAP